MARVVPFARRADDVSGNENLLIAALYRCSLEPCARSALLQLLVERFSLCSASLAVERRNGQDHGLFLRQPGAGQPPARSRAAWPSFDRLGDLAQLRPAFSNGEARRQDGGVVSLDPSRRPARSHHILGVDVRVGAARPRLRLYRRGDARGFTAADADALARLAPHIEGVLTITAETARRARAQRLHDFVMDRVGIGLVIIAPDDRTILSNQTAAAMLAAGDGVRLSGERLEGCDRLDTRRLWTLIESARAENGKVFAGNLGRPCGRRDLAVMVRATPAAADTDGDDPPDIAVFLRDLTSRGAMDAKVLSEMFGFTNAEVRLAAALATGQSVEDAAAHLGIRVTTARAQFRSIFVKAGVNRQAELMRMLLI